MAEQNRSPRLQMNLTLKSVTTNIDASPEARKAVYRIALQLLRLSCDDEDGDQSRLAEALGYDNAKLMSADVDALTKLIVQMQSAFGEYDIPCKEFMPENNVTIPALAKEHRFELTCKDKSQLAELNAALERHSISWRELAIIVESLRIRRGLTLDDFPFGYGKTNLSGYATVELTRELATREGVESLCLGPYASTTMKMEGPATVLKVIV